MLSLQAMAQKETKKDTTRFTIGEYGFIIIDRGHRVDTLLVDEENDGKEDFEIGMGNDGDDMTYWAGFEFGPAILLNSSGGTTINSSFLDLDPAQSFAYSLNLFEKRIRFGTDHVGLVTGLGFTHARYGFKDSYTLRTDGDITTGVLDTAMSFNKNQLRAAYLNIPLLIQFNTSKTEDNNFHVAVGVIGGVRINSKTVQKFDVEGKGAKVKQRGVYNLNPFQASATARIGYKDIGLFANYSLMPLFETGATEEVYPLTFGLSLHF